MPRHTKLLHLHSQQRLGPFLAASRWNLPCHRPSGKMCKLVRRSGRLSVVFGSNTKGQASKCCCTGSFWSEEVQHSKETWHSRLAFPDAQTPPEAALCSAPHASGKQTLKKLPGTVLAGAGEARTAGASRGLGYWILEHSHLGCGSGLGWQPDLRQERGAEAGMACQCR